MVLQEALEEGVAATVGDGGAVARGLRAVSWGTRASWGLGGFVGNEGPHGEDLGDSTGLFLSRGDEN